jgi:hypothetical protein
MFTTNFLWLHEIGCYGIKCLGSRSFLPNWYKELKTGVDSPHPFQILNSVLTDLLHSCFKTIILQDLNETAYGFALIHGCGEYDPVGWLRFMHGQGHLFKAQN